MGRRSNVDRVKPILLDLGHFAIHSFGVMVAIGFLSGTWLAARRAKAVGIDPVTIQDLVFPWLLIGALLGARLLYVVSYWKTDFAPSSILDIFAIWKGGLVFYGGLIGATAAGIWRVWQKSLPAWRIADCMAPGLALGHAMGRLGCFLNGCCYGTPTTLPWAIRFPDINHELFGTPLGWVHPVQIYESSLNLVLCVGLVLLHQKRLAAGTVGAAYLMGYAVIRAFVELFRGDYVKIGAAMPGGLKPGQYTSLAIFVAGLIVLYLAHRNAKKSVISS